MEVREMKHTVYGSDKIELQIENDMRHILSVLQKKVDFSNIKAIVLGGGYGRGEGGVFIENEDEYLFNDYDFFLFSKTNKQLKKLHHEVQNCSPELTKDIGIDVDFSFPYPIRILPHVPFFLFWYDLKLGNKVIYGEKNLLNAMPNWQGSELPIMEAAKLLLNRATGLILISQKLENNTNLTDEEHEFIKRNLVKAIIACGDAYLICKRKYHHSYVKRKETVSTLKDEIIGKSEFVKMYSDAIEHKLKPEKQTKSIAEWKDELEKVRDMFEEFYLFTFSELAGFQITDFHDYRNWILDAKPSPNIKQIGKNVLLNLKYNLVTPKPINLLFLYPRYRLFYALPYLLFDLDWDNSIGNILPVVDKKTLLEMYLTLWDRFN
jgi:hypothetical protein